MPTHCSGGGSFPHWLFNAVKTQSRERRWCDVFTSSLLQKLLAGQSSMRPATPNRPRSLTIALFAEAVKSVRLLMDGYLFGTVFERIQAAGLNPVTPLAAAPLVGETPVLQREHAPTDTAGPSTTDGNIQPGRRVRVKHGVLTGLEG